MQSRRSVLRAALSILCPLSVTNTSSFASTEAPRNLYISGARESTDRYVAVIFDGTAKLLATVPLNARAHGAAAHSQTNRACIFGRRPGYFMNTFDVRSPQHQNVITPIHGRHFYGHGAYSDNGNLLYATENDFDNARGTVGIYDAANNYKRIGELDSYGIGPHEIIRVPGSSLLVIANGGIQTHPDTGREKLNIATMRPSLSIVDSSTGHLVGRHVLADNLHQVSIRHLACSADGDLWYAAQYEGNKSSIDGLIGRVSIKESLLSFQHGESKNGLTHIDIPEIVQRRASRYLSSVAVVGQHVVFTCAKGGFIFQVNRQTQRIDDSVSILDCSGVAAMPSNELSTSEEFKPHESALVTSGTGEIVRISEEGMTSINKYRLQWDNHLYRV